MISESDKNLVQAAQNGDIDSFGLLYERYYPLMYSLAYSIVADSHLAQDAAQQSFAVACGNISQLKSKEKFAGWLGAICRNTSRDIRRQKSRYIVTDRIEAGITETDHNADEEIEMIRAAIWKLRPIHREVLFLRYYNGSSYKEISKIYGLSESAVHGRVTRARRKLAVILTRNGFSGGNHEKP